MEGKIRPYMIGPSNEDNVNRKKEYSLRILDLESTERIKHDATLHLSYINVEFKQGI